MERGGWRKREAQMPIKLENKDTKLLLTAIQKSGPWTGAMMTLVKRLERSLRQIKVASGKAKGRDLQMWVCGKIAELSGVCFDQHDDQCLIHSREMGQAGIDIVLRGEALRKFPFSVECKNSEGLSMIEALQQAQSNCSPGTAALVVHKRKSLKQPVVIMEWDTFESLVKRGGR